MTQYFRFTPTGSGLHIKFSISKGGWEDMIYEYTLQETSDPIIPVKWVQIRNPKGWKTDPDDLTPLQLRNLRNPDKDTTTCLNNVGSFQCVSNDEENIAIRRLEDWPRLEPLSINICFCVGVGLVPGHVGSAALQLGHPLVQPGHHPGQLLHCPDTLWTTGHQGRKSHG